MGKYNNGMETQQNILAVCREMFYEKGYEKTTFKDISEALSIHQSAIHYHFKSKENILSIIYAETVAKNNDLVELYSDRSTTFLAKLFFDLYIYLYKILKDEKYRRFYLSATKYRFSSVDFIQSDTSRFNYNMYHRNEKIVVPEDEDLFNRMACSGFDRSVLVYIDTNIDTVEFDYIYKNMIHIYAKILNIKEKYVDSALEEVSVMCDRCKWDAIDTTLAL